MLLCVPGKSYVNVDCLEHVTKRHYYINHKLICTHCQRALNVVIYKLLKKDVLFHCTYNENRVLFYVSTASEFKLFL